MKTTKSLTRQFCARCGRELDDQRIVTLELDQRTMTYAPLGSVPEAHSQGCFSFGVACAKKELKEHKLGRRDWDNENY